MKMKFAAIAMTALVLTGCAQGAGPKQGVGTVADRKSVV